MKTISPGALSALLTTALLAAPASAANVTVRVEGEAQTLVPRTAVATSESAVGKPGQPTCAGNSALGALDSVTGGDWDGPHFAGLGYALETLKGETHAASTSSYWAFWINHNYSNLGVCDQPVSDGDDLLFVPECYAAGCVPSSPLRLSGVPAVIAPDTTVVVKVEAYTSGSLEPTPAAGATVSFGGATTTTRADGTAVLSFTGAGISAVQATKTGHVRSATESTCVTNAADGNCGSPPPAGGVLGPQEDRFAPSASFSRLTYLRVFKRKRAPRKVAGTVTPDPSGLAEVRLSIMRRVGGRCWTFDGAASERFKRGRCAAWRSFTIGDRADWSYLLPKRLRKGRYVIRVVAVDKAGNDSVTKTVIYVV